MPAAWPGLTLGNPADPPLVFLHGFLGRGSDWLPIAAAFTGRYFCVLPDLPGHGDNSDFDSLSFESLAAGLDATLAELGPPRPVLAGYSLGGRAALHYACTYPGALGGLVLESASPGITDESERAARAALDDKRAAAIRRDGLQVFLENWYRAGLWDSLRRRPELLKGLMAGRTAGDPEGPAAAVSGLSPGRMPPLWDCLPGLDLPVLVLAGELDEQYAALAPQVAGRIPGARLEIVAEAGHNVHLERPEVFRGAVEKFLSV